MATMTQPYKIAWRALGEWCGNKSRLQEGILGRSEIIERVKEIRVALNNGTIKTNKPEEALVDLASRAIQDLQAMRRLYAVDEIHKKDMLQPLSQSAMASPVPVQTGLPTAVLAAARVTISSSPSPSRTAEAYKLSERDADAYRVVREKVENKGDTKPYLPAWQAIGRWCGVESRKQEGIIDRLQIISDLKQIKNALKNGTLRSSNKVPLVNLVTRALQDLKARRRLCRVDELHQTDMQTFTSRSPSPKSSAVTNKLSPLDAEDYAAVRYGLENTASVREHAFAWRAIGRWCGIETRGLKKEGILSRSQIIEHVKEIQAALTNETVNKIDKRADSIDLTNRALEDLRAMRRLFKNDQIHQKDMEQGLSRSARASPVPSQTSLMSAARVATPIAISSSPASPQSAGTYKLSALDKEKYKALNSKVARTTATKPYAIAWRSFGWWCNVATKQSGIELDRPQIIQDVKKIKVALEVGTIKTDKPKEELVDLVDRALHDLNGRRGIMKVSEAVRST